MTACLNIISKKKDFVNSIGVQTRMLSDVSCLLSQGCQYQTSSAIIEAQIKVPSRKN